MGKKIRVLIADDHPLLTSGLEMAIGGWDEFEVCGVAATGIEAVELCHQTSPDVVVMDMRMPEMSGGEAIGEIKAGNPSIRILALTTFDDSETVASAMNAGCDGFLLKVTDPAKLRSTLLTIMAGVNVYDEGIMAKWRESKQPKAALAFTDREREILACLCEGMTNAEIADRVGLRTGTVKNLVSLLLSKAGCVSRAQLVRFATDNGLVD